MGVVPDGAIETLARVLANEALLMADMGGYGWNAETDSSDHFMDSSRVKARKYLEAVLPYMVSSDPEPQPGDGPDYHTDHAFWLMRSEKRREVLEGIRRRNEERKASQDVGGVREWFEIDYLLRHIDKLERKLDEG